MATVKEMPGFDQQAIEELCGRDYFLGRQLGRYREFKGAEGAARLIYDTFINDISAYDSDRLGSEYRDAVAIVAARRKAARAPKYVADLRDDLADVRAERDTLVEMVDDLVRYLSSPKFGGDDPLAGYVNVRDVLTRLGRA